MTRRDYAKIGLMCICVVLVGFAAALTVDFKAALAVSLGVAFGLLSVNL